MGRGDDQSSNRLTIAQAALLNLRGQEYQAQAQANFGVPSQSHHIQHLHHPQLPPALDFVPRTMPNIPGSEIELEQLRRASEYTQLAGGEYDLQTGDYHTHAHQHLQHLHSQAHFRARLPVPALSAQYNAYMQQDVVNPDIGLLLDSRRRGGLPFTADTHAHGRIMADVDYTSELGVPMPAQAAMPLLGIGQTQARNGYTPAEELILRAHAHVNAVRNMGAEGRHVRRGAVSMRAGAPTGVDIGMGMRAQRGVASTMAYPQQRGWVPPAQSPNTAIELVPSVSEDAFHSNAASQHAAYRQQLGVDENRRATRRHEENIHGLSREFDSISLLQQQQQQQQQQQTPSFAYDSQAHAQTAQKQNQTQNQTHAPHIRATTLPHLSSSSQGSNQLQRHYQHSSMSALDCNRTGQNQATIHSQNQTSTQNQYQNQNHDQHHVQSQAQNQNSRAPKQKQQNREQQYSISVKNGGGVQVFDHRQHDGNGIQNMHMHHGHGHGIHYPDVSVSANTTNSKTRDGDASTYNSSNRGPFVLGPPNMKRGDAYEEMAALDNAASPPLVSPALTYSSRTPATLSPSTPFFSAFGQAGFEGPGVGVGVGVGVEGPGGGGGNGNGKGLKGGGGGVNVSVGMQ
jgi:hypothetical protein